MPKITPEQIKRGVKALVEETGGFGAEDDKRAVEAILTAALSAQPVVKPLEWRQGYRDDQVATQHAPTIPHYIVEYYYGGFCLSVDGVRTSYPSEEAAKAAAQADYDARILSALTTPPAPAASEPVDEPASKFGRLFPSKTPEEVDRDPAYRQVQREMKPLRDMILRDTPPAPTGDGWRPIETAPKDGTRILFWDQDCEERAVIGAYLHGRWWPEGEDNVKVAPRGWMPLPAAPTPPKEGGRDD